MQAQTNEQIEVIEEIENYFKQNKSFYLCCSVVAPYDGCFHEPNAFLITPKNNVNDFNSEILVKPLYANGQGKKLIELKSKEEIIKLIENEKLEDDWRTIDCFSTGNVNEPINKATPLHETYWVQALSAAKENFGIELDWVCEKCEKVHTYDECDAPQFTGYRGNGGVGVFMEGALCSDCIEEGLCRHCGQDGWPHEHYDSDIAENGYCLCQYCTEKLLENVISGEWEFPEYVDVEWHKDENQLCLLGVEQQFELRLSFDNKNLNTIAELEINIEQLFENIEAMHLEDMSKPYGYNHGMTLAGKFVENIAFNNVA
jgi:hypothetical protein